MNPEQSRKFLKGLIGLALVYLALGVAAHFRSPGDVIAFIQIFLFTFLDLVCLILIFWKIFFVPREQPGRMFQILLFVFFKLVCMGFLAITLKRLRNAPLSVILMGTGFIWIGPWVTGLLSRYSQLKHKD